MRVGVVFPQTEIGADVGRRAGLRQRPRSSGYPHILAYDHVLGADPEDHPPWSGPYDVDTTFHEPFVLFGYLAGDHAARTGDRRDHPAAAPDRAGRQAGRRGRPAHRRPVAPRRRDRLERGRVRGARARLHRPRPAVEEQIGLLRRLWTERSSPTRASTNRHGAGLDPLPVQRPIPIWIGGHPRRPTARGPARRRLVPAGPPGPDLDEARAIVADAARAAGRDPAPSAGRAG